MLRTTDVTTMGSAKCGRQTWPVSLVRLTCTSSARFSARRAPGVAIVMPPKKLLRHQEPDPVSRIHRIGMMNGPIDRRLRLSGEAHCTFGQHDAEKRISLKARYRRAVPGAMNPVTEESKWSRSGRDRSPSALSDQVRPAPSAFRVWWDPRTVGWSSWSCPTRTFVSS
jgi:hypothetical protein